ncbi:glycosyltransferase family 8 protein [Salinicola rhizosphaerae]|uniref:LPS 3-alpha-galactosyltransferase n=1 Tax=Salinicola rhizosphaerae TaxID=1443141 RepID=A0ABQ3DSI0_9GAMM|nr:glycosyltransferase [Salinicola rhizosphaerae]GHB14410.1 LPS 3-alpha-galactosyltransferase [Salinicola rhizosphaerae]
MQNHDVRIAFGTDMGLLAPTALALDSALRTTSVSQVDILGVSLTLAAKNILHRIAGEAKTRLVIHELEESSFTGVTYKGGHVPNAALARLYLPHIVDERVLYIDGDTLIQRNLRSAFDISMGGSLIAGVRDFSRLKKECKFQRGRSWSTRSEVEAIVSPSPIESYINSGVLVIDCAAIRREPTLADDMLKFERANKYSLVDQDYINELFKGRILHLNPSWNSSWGRHHLQARWAKELGYSGEEVRRESARILHFHGAEKPWRKMPRERWKRSLRASLAYKVAFYQFKKRFPDLSFV